MIVQACDSAAASAARAEDFPHRQVTAGNVRDEGRDAPKDRSWIVPAAVDNVVDSV